jgi:hypothetical protein
MDNALYRSFIAQYPSCARLIVNLDRIEKAISPKCFDSFFEPVAIQKTTCKLTGMRRQRFIVGTQSVSLGLNLD